jgi:hypothetical protein
LAQSPILKLFGLLAIFALVANCVNLEASLMQYEFNVKVIDLPAGAESKSGDHIDLGYQFHLIPGMGEWIGYVSRTTFYKLHSDRVADLLILMGRDPADTPSTPLTLILARISWLFIIVAGTMMQSRKPDEDASGGS